MKRSALCCIAASISTTAIAAPSPPAAGAAASCLVELDGQTLVRPDQRCRIQLTGKAAKLEGVYLSNADFAANVANDFIDILRFARDGSARIASFPRKNIRKRGECFEDAKGQMKVCVFSKGRRD